MIEFVLCFAATAKARLVADHPAGLAAVGVDALRFGLLRHDVLALDVHVDVRHMLHSARFGNKLWQAVNYAQANYWTTSEEWGTGVDSTVDDRLYVAWIRSRLRAAVDTVDACMTEYQFAKATAALHEFVWAELCGVFIELSKTADRANVR